TGGAAPTATLIEQLDTLGIDIVHLYGLTESFGPATLRTLPDRLKGASPADKAACLAQQGFSHPAAGRVRVVDSDGIDVASDGQSMGEVLLAGNTLMAGYLHDPAATDEAFADGWFHTGDLAVRHADGAIELKDRSKDIIISGGENISSLEVESVLHRHPAVLLAAVVAAPDEKWGERIVAVLQPRAGKEIDAAVVTAFVKQRIGSVKTPKQIEVWDDLPRSKVGKVLKSDIRATLLAKGKN
ncbi:AMP-binding protein, partial [Rhizobiaceae sp. 2RAB30]